MQLLYIPPHSKRVSTLPCEILMQEKLAILDSKRAGKWNTLPTKNAVNDLYDARRC